MLQYDQYGDIGKDGGRRQPTRSALSGRSVDSGDVIIQFPNKRRFVVVRASEWRDLDEEERQAVREYLAREVDAVEAEAGPVSQVTGVEAYRGMPFAELRKLAADRDIDTKGARSADDYISRLVAADVVARYGGTPLAVPSTPSPADAAPTPPAPAGAAASRTGE